mmetsp:Transcript_12619/g.29817  ORF Transcript_12619/g.29817 Transcript_12619/m.29817 type:complete len:1002 (-) Transcript_12619:1101-4106(-)
MNALFQAVLDAEGSSSFEEALRQESPSSSVTPDVVDVGDADPPAPSTPPSTPVYGASREPNDDTQAFLSPRAPGNDGTVGPCVPNWYQMFNQVKDFSTLRWPKNKPPPQRLREWMDEQRRRYAQYGTGSKEPVGIIKGRVASLRSIHFDWSPQVYESVPPPIPPIEDLLIAHQDPLAEDPFGVGSSTHLPAHSSRNMIDMPSDGLRLSLDSSVTGRKPGRHRNRTKHGIRPEWTTLKNDRGRDAVDAEALHTSRSGRTRKPSRKTQESYDPTGLGMVARSAEGPKSQLALAEIPPSQPEEREVIQGVFPGLLHKMITETTKEDPMILAWSDDGLSFELKDEFLLTSVLPRHFEGAILSKFMEMLDIYGFARDHANYNMWHHPHFFRDSCDLGFVKRIGSLGDGIDDLIAPIGLPSNSSRRLSSSRGSRSLPSSRAPSSSPEKERRKKKRPPSRKDPPAPNVEGPRFFDLEPDDVCFSLKDDKYKNLMYEVFNWLGKKEGKDDKKLVHQKALEVLHRLKTPNGRLFKAVKGGGAIWYEECDDDYAISKICQDSRRRMDSFQFWWNGSNPQAKNRGPRTAPPVKVQESRSQDTSENENEQMISGSSQYDVVVSMKDERYRNAMFRLFANLGSRGYKEDNTHGPASEQLTDFKKHMGPNGNFLRRRHGGRGGFHFTLLTEEQALELMMTDIRKRMATADSWLDEGDSSPSSRKKRKSSKNIESTAAPDPTPSKRSRANPINPADLLIDGPTSLPGMWSLGTISFQGSNIPVRFSAIDDPFASIKYYKSSFRDGWIDQVIPRRKKSHTGPAHDKYYLSPDGERFRSLVQARTYTEQAASVGAIPTEAGGKHSESDRPPRKRSGDADKVKDESLSKRSKISDPSPVGFFCPYCQQDFYYETAQTAKASFSRHAKACAADHGEVFQDTPAPVKATKKPAKRDPSKRSPSGKLQCSWESCTNIAVIRGMCHRHDQETSGEKKNRSSSGLMADENDKILVQSTPSDVVG